VNGSIKCSTLYAGVLEARHLNYERFQIRVPDWSPPPSSRKLVQECLYVMLRLAAASIDEPKCNK